MLQFLLSQNADGEFTLSAAGYVTFLVIAVAALLIGSTIFQKKEKKNSFSTRQLAFCGVMIALATVTSMIKVFTFPFGGSVTLLSMLFICLAGYFYGAKAGLPVAIAYGIIQLFLNPIVYYPMQLVIDYVLAFGALGLAGFFWKQKHGLLIGYLAGIVGRWIFATLSGYIFFAEYAWEGWNPLVYSMTYNGAYIFAEGLITIIVLLLPPVADAMRRIKAMAQA